MAELGLHTSFLSVILSQAAIVLIACSVLLVLVKDLYETHVKTVGLSIQRKKEKENRLVLSGRCADRLRVFLRLFSILLPSFYLFIGLCVLLVEKGKLVTVDGQQTKQAEVRSPFSAWDFSFSFGLQQVYVLELIFHFIIVFLVAFTFFWMTGVRREAMRERLRERPSD